MSDEPSGEGGGPRTLAEVPFPRHDDLGLLGLLPDAHGERREQPDHDFAGYGYGVVQRLILESEDGTRRELASALVLALHCTDEPEGDDEIELELDIPDPDGGEEITVLAPLGAFLRAHLPTLPEDPADVVLALCNPHALDVTRPEGLGERRLHFARGDVFSWLDLHDRSDGADVRLRAHSWHLR